MALNFISPKDALDLHQKGLVRFLDCRWSQKDAANGGRKMHTESHLPNATFVDLDTVLAEKPSPQTGRHPLPPLAQFTAWVTSQRLETAPGSRVVVYDESGGAIAGRCWWMLRCVNLQNVSILEGGFNYWSKELKYPLSPPAEEKSQEQVLAGVKAPFSGPYPSSWEKGGMPIVDLEVIKRFVKERHLVLLDARSAARYTSPPEGPPTEPDAVSGHVPGAKNRPFNSNLVAPNNTVKAKEALAAEYKELFGGRPITEVVSSCGSGVSACINIAAMEYAGLGIPPLFVGSWTMWSKLYPKLNHDNAKLE